MIRFLAAGLFALLMALAEPASAQMTTMPRAQQQLAMRNIGAVMSAGQDISAILIPIMNDPGLASARTKDQFSAALTRLLPSIADGRSELASIRAGLQQLPKIGEPGGLPALIGVDNAVENMLALSLLADGILADYEALAEAIAADDQLRIDAVSRSLLKGPILLLEANAVSMRSQLPLIGSDSTEYALLEGMACFYDGAAAFYDGAYGFSTREDAAASMASAQTCMVSQIEDGRANFAAESRNVPPVPTAQRMYQQVIPVIGAMFDHQATGADLLAEARGALMEGWGMLQLVGTYDARIIAFQLDFSRLQQRLVTINQTQGR